MFKNILVVFLSSLLIIGCHKDFDSGEDITQTQFMPEIKSQVEGSVLGYVYDETGQPVSDARVEIYGAQTTTDNFGVFLFSKRLLDQHGTYIRVSKAGYITASDKVYPLKDLLYSRVRMFLIRNDNSFESTSGGDIKMEQGGSLIFPANGIITGSGSVYEGKVYVTSRYLSPDSPTIADEMPGDLLGGTTAGISSVLGTAGMFFAELRDEAGRELQIKPGSKVKFSIPATSKNRPATIPLWYFDENRGYWIEEGQAVLSGDDYIGEVGHFSFWNCDAPFPLVEICGSVKYSDGNVPLNIHIKAEADGLGTAYGYPDINGNFSGKFPKNKKITLYITNYNCNVPEKIVEIGPFTSKTILDPIILDNEIYKLSGLVTCNNIPVKNALVVVKYDGRTSHILADENGFYSLSLIKCEGAANIVTVFAYDLTTLKASQIEEVNVTSVVEKNIEICPANCVLEGTIENKCDYLQMLVTQGSGQYDYFWSNGDSSEITTSPLSFQTTLYCVTVTDKLVPECKQVFCYEYKGKLQISIETTCNNPFQVFPFGGTRPYTYLWHNGATTEVVVLNTGESYCVTVTDAAGCTAKSCGIFEEIILDSNINGCSKDKFNIISTPFISGAIIKDIGGTIPINSLFGLSVFQTGFKFNIVLQNGVCSAYQTYSLPNFKGLSIKNVINTTCGTCTDGFIDVGIDDQAPCISCLRGAVRIFNINQLTVDLSSLNTANMLPKGEYYVVVEDMNTGCYIAYERVIID
jgi:hypothetical protein